MPSTGRQNGDIARSDFDFLAAVAAKPDSGMAARDAKRFVDRRVIVQIIVDAVASHIAPAIGAEQSLDGFLGVVVID